MMRRKIQGLVPLLALCAVLFAPRPALAQLAVTNAELTSMPAKAVMQRFGAIGLPTYAIVAPQPRSRKE